VRSDEKYHGLEVSILEDFAKLHDLNIEFIPYEFDGIWRRVATGEVDVVAAGLYSEDRESPGVHWTLPHLLVNRSLIVRPEDWLSNPKRLYGNVRRLGVVKGSSAHVHTLRNYEGYLEYIPSIQEGAYLVLTGELDAVGTGSITADYTASFMRRLSPTTNFLRVVRISDVDEPISFAATESLKAHLDHFLITYS
jgi:ABC-type amino acid transport substrate-binding protein